ncbi:hypothetical protein MUGA111182_13910 [Mucilaginibacter galii]|uniref:Uncharacterized protein n=1 Tax=Mucilaginibacter galii TaxID=2005073 RepID=A0A917J915_9SPHI|nr:hypothetical protein [Mucilaginibacter galii]GGI49676.1 hypothetical protein GCM10011425_08880 [Mucilaginibacter galii]
MADLHPVTIRFNYKTEDFDYLDKLQDGIERGVTYHKVGVYDTYELDEANNQAIFFLSTHDPEVLFRNLKPILEESPILKGAKIDVEMGRAEDGTRIVKEYQL